MLTVGDILGLWHAGNLDYSLTHSVRAATRVVVRRTRYDGKRGAILIDVHGNDLGAVLEAAHATYLVARDDGTLWQE